MELVTVEDLTFVRARLAEASTPAHLSMNEIRHQLEKWHLFDYLRWNGIRADERLSGAQSHQVNGEWLQMLKAGSPAAGTDGIPFLLACVDESIQRRQKKPS